MPLILFIVYKKQTKRKQLKIVKGSRKMFTIIVKLIYKSFEYKLKTIFYRAKHLYFF